MPKIPPITVTVEELKKIDDSAAERKMTRTEFVRSSALHRRDTKQILVDPMDFKFISEATILARSIRSGYRAKEDVILDINDLVEKLELKLDACQRPD